MMTVERNEATKSVASMACRELLREIRSRGQRSCTTVWDTRMFERSFVALVRLFECVHSGSVRFAREIPESAEADAACIGTAYPSAVALPDGPYRVAAVHACEVFACPRATWATPENGARHAVDVLESQLRTLRGSLGSPPGILFDRMETNWRHLLRPDDHRSVMTKVGAIAAMHRAHVLRCIRSYHQLPSLKRLGASSVRDKVTDEVAARASSGLERALIEFISVLYAGRWQAVGRALPLMTFLSDHALLGVRGSTVLVLYG